MLFLTQAHSNRSTSVGSVTIMTLPTDHCRQFAVVDVDKTLRAPIGSELRRKVDALLNRGERCILLDLARLTDIDAAGIGELIRAYTSASARGGVLQVVHARGYVRQLLDVAGISAVLGVATADC
jgi:anti-anti-sigma factor